MKDLSDLIPEECYSDFLPTKNEREFIYVGRANIIYWSDYWAKKARDYKRIGMSSNNLEMRICLVDEAQQYEKKAQVLSDLACRAEDKPLFYHQEPYTIGQHITCFVQGALEGIKCYSKSNRFANAVVTHSWHDSTGIIYLLGLRDDKNDLGSQRFWFNSDNVSAIPTDDFRYLRVYPHFFELYLNIRAKTASERGKIKSILSLIQTSG